MIFQLYTSVFSKLHYYIGVIKCSNYDLGFFVPEAQPRDTKHTVVIIAIRLFNKDNTLMA